MHHEDFYTINLTLPVIVSKLLPIGILGFYGFAYTTASKSGLITSAISQASFPSFSAQFKTGDHSGLMSQYRKMQDLLCFAIVPIFAAIPFALLPVFSYAFNDDIARLLLLPTTLLCIGFYMNGTLNIPYVFSLTVGKPGIAARANFYALFVVLPMTAFLIYFLGLTGAGLSWVFYHVFGYFYGVPRMCRECLSISSRSWYWHIFKIFVLVILTYGVGWGLVEFIGSYSIPSLISAYTGASIVFLICAYFMIGDELRNALLQFPKALKIKIAGA